jgi:hypothetical protein
MRKRPSTNDPFATTIPLSIHDDAEQALSGKPEGHWRNDEYHWNWRASRRFWT